MRAIRTICVAVALLLLAAVCTAAPAEDVVTSIPDYGPLQSTYYAGYLNATETRRAFYMFVESSGNPKTDQLVLWLNGGPGCSSLMGMFEENGPYTMRHGGAFEPNAFNWAQLANVLYIESPGGVGFSIDTPTPTNWTDDLAAEYNFRALQSFYKKFPEFGQHKLFITGESYAGFYVPELSHRIFHSDDVAIKSVMQGFMVGNPCTGDIGCANPDPFLIPFLQYNGFMALNPTVTSVLNNVVYDPYDLLVPDCLTAATMQQVRFPHPVADAYKRRVKRLRQSVVPFPYGPCADDYVTKWINRADVKAALHAEASITWASCSTTITYEINLNGVVPLYRDMMENSNYQIMIYSGLDDSIVNQAQTQTIVNDMGRPLVNNTFQPWYLPYVYNTSQTQLGGFYLQYDRISWAGVRNSGHMVPEYNPPAGLELIKSFLELGRPGRLPH